MQATMLLDDGVYRRIGRRRIGHIQRQTLYARGADFVCAFLRGGRADHRCALRFQLRGNGCAQTTACARNQSDFVF